MFSPLSLSFHVVNKNVKVLLSLQSSWEGGSQQCTEYNFYDGKLWWVRAESPDIRQRSLIDINLSILIPLHAFAHVQY